MGVSKNIIDLLNKKHSKSNLRIILKITDLVIGCDHREMDKINMGDKITKTKENLIVSPDNVDTEDIIDLLMDLEFNQSQYEKRTDDLLSRVEKLETLVEKMVDNDSIDFRCYLNKRGQLFKLDGEDWEKATKARDRRIRLKKILEKNITPK